MYHERALNSIGIVGSLMWQRRRSRFRVQKQKERLSAPSTTRP